MDDQPAPPSLSTIYRVVKGIVVTTPSDWNHATYVARLAHAFRGQGFTVRRQVRIPWRGTEDGRAGRLSIVLVGYAAIEVDGYLPHPNTFTKLSQAPEQCRLLAIVLRLGNCPEFMWDMQYVPKPHPSPTMPPPTISPIAIKPNIAVISAPMP